MKQLNLLLTIFCFALLTTNPINAQKQVNQIIDYYELEAYHLVIKKVNALKVKHQSRTNLQLILADAYWQTGKKERSAEIYKNVAVAIEIPKAFQTKFDQAVYTKINPYEVLIINSLSAEYLTLPGSEVTILEKLVKPVQKRDWFELKLELITKKAELNSIAFQAKPISITKPLVNQSVKKEMAPATKVKAIAVNNESESNRILPQNNNSIDNGKYRIRVGASTSLEAFNLVQTIGFEEVEVFEWAQRKIVIAGFYESPEKAQSYIDQHLRRFNDKAVVVTKVEGRYKSVAAVY